MFLAWLRSPIKLCLPHLRKGLVTAIPEEINIHLWNQRSILNSRTVVQAEFSFPLPQLFSVKKTIRLSASDFIIFVCFINLFFLFCNRGGRVVVFNASFNNISAISWRSVFLVKETGVPGENHRPVVSH